MENVNEKFKVWWDKENKIIHYKHFMDMQVYQETAVQIGEAIDEIIRDHPEASLLIDVNDVKSIPNSQARRALSGLTQKYLSRKVAIVNTGLAFRVAINFIITASGHKDTRAFATEEEALRWLKDNN